MIGNLTTVTSNLRDFTLTLLGYHFVDQIGADHVLAIPMNISSNTCSRGPAGHLIAETKVPLPGLTQEEFRLCQETVAIEADRFEFALTGKDQE